MVSSSSSETAGTGLALGTQYWTGNQALESSPAVSLHAHWQEAVMRSRVRTGPRHCNTGCDVGIPASNHRQHGCPWLTDISIWWKILCFNYEITCSSKILGETSNITWSKCKNVCGNKKTNPDVIILWIRKKRSWWHDTAHYKNIFHVLLDLE